MEQYKEIAKDPVKLEEELKKAWAKIDPKGQGSVTPQEFGMAMATLAKEMKLPERKPPTEEERAQFAKIADPQNTGRISYEGFVRLTKARIEKAKQEGKI